MAGIAGMGTPSKVQPPVPQPVPPMPQDVGLPPTTLENSPAQVPEEIDYDALAAEAVAQDAEIDYDALAAEAVAQSPEVGVAEELKARAKASFGGSPEQKKNLLEQTYGKGNVKIDGEDLYVKKDGKEQKFTRGMFDMLSDMIPAFYGNNQAMENIGRDVADLSKTLVGEAVALPAEIAGGLTGGPVGLAAGRAAGGALGEVAATKYGESIGANYSADGNDSLAGRAAIQGGTRAVVGFGVDKILGKIAAKQAARKLADDIPSIDTVAKEAVDTLDDAIVTLEQSGFNPKVKTTFGDVKYTPEQAIKSSQLAPDVVANAPSNSKEYIRANNLLAEKANEAILANHSRITAKAAKGGGQGAKFLEYADDIDKAEGALIGEFRKKAAEEAGDGEVVLSNLKKKIEEIGQRVGLDAEKKMTVENITKENLASTDTEARNLVSIYQELYNTAAENNGRVSMKDLTKLYNKMGSRIDFDKPGDAYHSTLIDLWRGIRDDQNQGINLLLDEGKVKSFSKKSYQEALDSFSGIKENASKLKNILGKSAITQEALAGQIFGSGTKNLETLNATKSLLKDAPEVWEALKKTQLDKYLQAAKNPKTGKIDGNAYFGAIEKLPKEIQMELFGSPAEMNIAKATKTYANRIQNFSAKNFAEDQTAKAAARDAVGFLTSNLKYKMDAGFRLLSLGGEDRALARYLSGPGQAEVLKMMPTNKRGAASKVIDRIIEESKNIPKPVAIEMRQALTPNVSDEN